MTLYIEDVEPGQELPPFQRKGDLESWIRFLSVNDEFMPAHFDLDVAKARGEREIFGSGNLRFAHLHCLLRTWIGEEGWIRDLKIQHRGVNYKGDMTVAKGRVAGKRSAGGENLVDIELWCENQHGDLLDKAAGTVALPSRGD